MSKFVVVSKAPEKLEKGEIVINQPDFLEQVRENSRKAPKVKQTGINHLREVINAIAVKYDPELNVFKIPLVRYEGVAYKDEKDLSNIIVSLLKAEYPTVFDKYLDFQLKNRPLGTKLIYYVGNFNDTAPFTRAGLDLLDIKDIESYMTGKPKKVVGRPAITKEEADSNESEST